MKITIFGLGAIGSNLLVQLVRQFPDFEYQGVDYDKVEDRNMRIQAYFQEHIGQPKAFAIRTVAQRYVRKVKYTAQNHRVTKPSEFGIPSPIDRDHLHIDCFDNAASRKLITPKGDVPILHLGFSPFYTAECIWNKDYDVPGDVDPRENDICDMAAAVGFIHFFTNTALLTISDYVNDGQKTNFLITSKTRIKKI